MVPEKLTLFEQRIAKGRGAKKEGAFPKPDDSRAKLRAVFRSELGYQVRPEQHMEGRGSGGRA